MLEHLKAASAAAAAKAPPTQPPKSLVGSGLPTRESMQRQTSPQQGIPLTSPRESLQQPMAGSQEIYGGGVAQVHPTNKKKQEKTGEKTVAPGNVYSCVMAQTLSI